MINLSFSISVFKLAHPIFLTVLVVLIPKEVANKFLFLYDDKFDQNSYKVDYIRGKGFNNVEGAQRKIYLSKKTNEKYEPLTIQLILSLVVPEDK